MDPSRVISEPIILEVEKGSVVSIEGGDQARKLQDFLSEVNDPNAYQVAEIAVGMNPECRVTGNIIEDEGAYGTCHIALGNNNSSFGGLVDVPVHIDLLEWKPVIQEQNDEAPYSKTAVRWSRQALPPP